LLNNLNRKHCAILGANSHAVAYHNQTRLTAANAINFNKTVKTLTNHAVRQAWRTAYRRQPEAVNICPKQAGSNGLTNTRRQGFAVEKNNERCLIGPYREKHVNTCRAMINF
jgi:hypothetical protein